MRAKVARCVSCVPCEKFRRKISVPPAMSASSMASESLAGPTVAMILVCRTRMSIMSRIVRIVPGPVERYLASLNRLNDPGLEEAARMGDERGLPLVYPEVGALLRVLAIAVK